MGSRFSGPPDGPVGPSAAERVADDAHATALGRVVGAGPQPATPQRREYAVDEGPVHATDQAFVVASRSKGQFVSLISASTRGS
jgi:hypothetical protein